MAEGAGGEPAQGLLERLVAAILALVQALVELDDGAPARDAGGEPDAARPAAGLKIPDLRLAARARGRPRLRVLRLAHGKDGQGHVAVLVANVLRDPLHGLQLRHLNRRYFCED